MKRTIVIRRDYLQFVSKYRSIPLCSYQIPSSEYNSTQLIHVYTCVIKHVSINSSFCFLKIDDFANAIATFLYIARQPLKTFAKEILWPWASAGSDRSYRIWVVWQFFSTSRIYLYSLRTNNVCSDTVDGVDRLLSLLILLHTYTIHTRII